MSGEFTPEARAAVEEKDDNQNHDKNGEGKKAGEQSNNEKVESSRKYQRGGRKPTSKSTQTPERRKPWSERNGRLEGLSESDEELKDEEAEHDADPASHKSRPENDVPKDFETGIKAFNLKRAQSTGSGRPFGVSIDREKAKGEKSKKSKKKEKKKKKKKKAEDDSEEDDSESSSDEEPPRKPLSIRLDLNLELEIFLRAKVKGDITITFLE